MNFKAILLALIILLLSCEVCFAFSSLDVDCEDIKYGQTSQISVRLPGDARGNVTVNINNESYTYSIENSTVYGLNGILLMPVEIDGLKVGEYDVTVCYDNMTAKDSFNVTNVHRYSFNSSDVVKDYKNDTQYACQVLADGEAIGAGQNVEFHVNGVDYVRTTDGDGVAHLNINLEPGNYIVKCEYRNFTSYNNIMVL